MNEKGISDATLAAPPQAVTLRDYFAAQALTGMLAGAMSDGSPLHLEDCQHITMAAFMAADHMLEARK